jgi:hypothetical protein
MIQIDLSGLKELRIRLDSAPRAIEQAVGRALNRAGDQALTAMGRVLAKESGLAVRAVREKISAIKAEPGDLAYTIRVRGGAEPVGHFAPRKTRKGISARPWAKRRVFPGTFFIPRAKQRVFKRLGKERLPIQQLWGPDLAKEVERGQSLEMVKTASQEAFGRRLAHELSRILGGSLAG